jgi:tetratricopeptide (TPR) repeat protein
MGQYEQRFIDQVLSKHAQHAAQRVVETGTCAGYSTRKLSRIYQHVDTVELSEDLSAKTRASMDQEGFRNVRFHVGDSAQVLRTVVREIQEPCVFYLDAHWSGDETVDWKASVWKGYGVNTAHCGARGRKPTAEEQVPLLAEMRIICETFPHRAIIYIDDFALFGTDGRGKKDVSFVGNDWSHLHVDDLKKVCGKRLVDWVVDEGGHQVAIVLAAVPVGTLFECVSTSMDVVYRGAAADMMRRAEVAKPLLGLVMIVKDEARRIAEVLAAYRPYINAWTILDTGSSDGTQDLICSQLDGIPGRLHEEPFVDFATSRNRALELHDAKTVFTIMPNGDVLQGGPLLVAFLEAHRNDHAGAYRVRISPGHYYHPLVMRTGAGWRYKWRTHECATGSNGGPAIPGVMVIRDRGNRTDAEWRDRWTRDLDLLHRDRCDDPSDPRAYFYLGQTHECLGQNAQALAFFERRAELGGYFDEVYEAKFRIGKMKTRLGRPWAEVQQAYLEAYAHDPRRAEPLHAIAEHWYDKELHAVTRIFAAAAADLPKPSTDLFLDEEIYSWRAADTAAIASFYAGRKPDGRRFAEQAVKQRPDDERLRANRAFYAQSASELFGATAKAIEFQPETGWNASNPSICYALDRLRCIVRTVNYRIVNGSYVTPDGDGVIRTRNFLLDLDNDLKTTRTVEMLDKDKTPRTSFPIHGFEDARLFAWKKRWWATATVCDFTEGRREIALLELDDKDAIVHAEPLRGPWGVHSQKNWMPLIEENTAKLIYATRPSTIFELSGKNRKTSIQPPEGADYGAHGRLRGGSQAVRIGDGCWIYVVHDVAFPGSGRIYLHRFVLLNARLELISMSDPFYFERLGIEFCAGLALVGERLVASYAINDGEARLGTFTLASVLKSLRTDFVI